MSFRTTPAPLTRLRLASLLAAAALWQACGSSNHSQADAAGRDGPLGDGGADFDAGPAVDARGPGADSGLDGGGADGASADSGLVEEGDTTGACSDSLEDVSQPLCDGVYANDIGARTFPSGAVIRAQHPGLVRFTGAFSPGDGLVFRGIVLDNQATKELGNDNLYEDMSFVGGPACGNTVNASVGSRTTIRRSAFYGAGGRYLLLSWQVSDVTVEDAIFRGDGGWGVGSDCNEWEPNAALNFYDTNNATCRGCVLFDHLSTATSESETLGGLGVNCHNTATGALFENSLSYNALPFWADGNGTCDDVAVVDSVAVGGTGGIQRNVLGTTTATRFSSDRGCGAWRGQLNLVDSDLAGPIDGCAGTTDGAGAKLTLNTAFLDQPRWRRELCDEVAVTRGWCATNLSLSAYLEQ